MASLVAGFLAAAVSLVFQISFGGAAALADGLPGTLLIGVVVGALHAFLGRRRVSD